MDAERIERLGVELTGFLDEFDDCFGRSEPRSHLRTYIGGQLSNLPRKSIEPMALATDTPPRTLQRFLESVQWDEARLRDRVQRIVARDHADPHAIGLVDETGNPKKGRHTAAVKRQWCGNTGKIDNCVVSVHTGSTAGDFQCLLDSDVYLPEDWADDATRRQTAHIPEAVVYRKKTDIALDQIRRGLKNGVRVEAWTFDEWYGRDGSFLDGLDALGQNYVAEVPSTFTGWLHEPKVLQRSTPQEMRKRGRKRRFPRLARKTAPACEVRNLVTYSPVFQKQKWRRWHVKDGENGPMVWEVKSATFYRKLANGLPSRPHCLIVARNVLNPDEIKYFIANQVPGAQGVSLAWLLHVAFSRWPIEHCFRQAKDELGLDHFEVRGWRSIHRHLYITQLSHLFCSRVHQGLREKNDRWRVPDGGTSARRGVDLGGGSRPAAIRASAAVPSSGQANRLPSTPQPPSSNVPHQNNTTNPEEHGHPSRPIAVPCAG